MKTFKVYIRVNGQSDQIFVEAPSLENVKWRVLGRFYNASISKIVEV